MINRTLIRLKVIQILYSYLLRENKNVDAAEKELCFSLSKAFDLYNYLLALLPEFWYYAENRIELRRSKLQPTYEDLHPNMRFVENAFIRQLATNKALAENRKETKYVWSDHEDVVRRIFEKIEAADFYREYMAAGSTTYDEDRELWRRIYKTFICNNDELDELLESKSLYWNDDKDTIDTFVLKTIKRFEEKNGADQPLMEPYRSEEDFEYAKRLIRQALEHSSDYQAIIDAHCKNWDRERIAFMDTVIMTAAIAEVTSFPDIPVSVSLNEYVEIAKYYSTPKSAGFINGILDAVAKDLAEQGKLLKDAQQQ